LLGTADIQVVLEEDGTVIPNDVLSDVTDEGSPLGLLMLLQPSEMWHRVK
jgi:hypothetical protein